VCGILGAGKRVYRGKMEVEAVRLCPVAPDMPPGATVLSEDVPSGQNLIPAGTLATLVSIRCL
jgi:hypothetical protein